MAEKFFQGQDGSELKIADVRVTQPAGTLPPDMVIKKGEKFNVFVDLEYTELLGDVGANYSLKVLFQDIEKGGSQSAYNQAELKKLQKDTTSKTVEFKNIDAMVEGIFKIHTAVTVPASDIAAMTEGPYVFVFST